MPMPARTSVPRMDSVPPFRATLPGRLKDTRPPRPLRSRPFRPLPFAWQGS